MNQWTYKEHKWLKTTHQSRRKARVVAQEGEGKKEISMGINDVRLMAGKPGQYTECCRRIGEAKSLVCNENSFQQKQSGHTRPPRQALLKQSLQQSFYYAPIGYGQASFGSSGIPGHTAEHLLKRDGGVHIWVIYSGIMQESRSWWLDLKQAVLGHQDLTQVLPCL